MKYTDIAWDFDGTLVDSYPNCIRAFKEAVESFGYQADEEIIRERMTLTIRHAIEYYSEKYGLDGEELRVRYKELEGFRPDLVHLYPEVAETLKAIKESGRRNHLYTNRNQMALQYLEALGVLEYFDGLITAENIGKLKPEPDGMIRLMEQYQVEAGKMLMVGDRAVDIVSAKGAGADGCFYNTNGIEVPEGTDIVVEHLMDLLNYL